MITHYSIREHHKDGKVLEVAIIPKFRKLPIDIHYQSTSDSYRTISFVYCGDGLIKAQYANKNHDMSEIKFNPIDFHDFIKEALKFHMELAINEEMPCELKKKIL